MKSGVAALIALFLGVSPANADTASEIRQGVADWRPISVSVENGVAKVILSQSRITDKVYLEALLSGICMMAVLYYKSKLEGITEIQILNQLGTQGYVFEGGLAECQVLNKLPIGAETEIEILGKTHLY